MLSHADVSPQVLHVLLFRIRVRIITSAKKSLFVIDIVTYMDI